MTTDPNSALQRQHLPFCLLLELSCLCAFIYEEQQILPARGKHDPSKEDDLTYESQVKDICLVECPSTCNCNKKKKKVLKHASFIKQHKSTLYYVG